MLDTQMPGEQFVTQLALAALGAPNRTDSFDQLEETGRHLGVDEAGTGKIQMSNLKGLSSEN